MIAAQVACYHLLGIRNEEESQVVAVIEHPESAADHRLAVRRVGQADSRLPSVVIAVDVGGQAGLVFPSQAIIDCQLAGNPPLILKESSPVAMINLFAVMR